MLPIFPFTLRSALNNDNDVFSSIVPNSGHFPVDVRRTEQALEFIAELPGFSTNDITVALDRNILTIQAKKEDAERREDNNWLRLERRFGQMIRRFHLPEVKVDEEKIEAQYKNGVLTVAVPFKTADKGRTIEVKNGE